MNFSLIRIGFFSLVGISIVVGFSFYVNDKPYWYKPCRSVDIFVSDATGLRRKSPVKTLGLEIGYISEVMLEGDKVLLKVCITAPIRLRSNTKASVKKVGFLGDKVLELKPVEMVRGSFLNSPNPDLEQSVSVSHASIERSEKEDDSPVPSDNEPEELELSDEIIDTGFLWKYIWQKGFPLFKWIDTRLVPSAHARKALTASDDAEISDLIGKGEKLVDQLNYLVSDVRKVTNQKEFRQVIVNMNKAVRNFERLVSPDSPSVKKLNEAVDHLKSALKQTEEIMAKVSNGEGTLGKLINDPSLYDEAKAAIRSINLLLGKAGVLKTYVDLRTVYIDAYEEGYRGTLLLRIEPNPNRYYLIGVGNDPRGAVKNTRTEIRNSTDTLVSVENKREIKEEGILVTAMFGKYFGGLDLRIGLIDSAGAIGVGYWFDNEKKYGIQSEFFRRTKEDQVQTRVYAVARLYMGLYAIVGTDEFKKSQASSFTKAEIPWFIGGGITFNDEDLKYLLAFR